MEIIADYRIISYRDNKPTKQVEDMIKYIEASKIINEKVYKFSDELQKYETNGGLVSDELKARIPTLMDNLSKVDWPMILYIPYSKSVVKEASNRLNNPNISILPFNATRIIGLNAFRNFMYKQNLGLPSSKNVLLPSILLMLNKGYKKVYLYGAEFSWTKTYSVELESGNIYSDDTHFYDKTRIPLKKGGFKFDLSCMVESLSATEYLEDYSNSINANIVNRTVGSYIDAFSYENPNHVTFS